MKKFIIITLSIIIIFLLGLNIYIVSSNDSISSSVDNLQSRKSEIDSLNSYSTNIINLAHIQKSFLLTGSENFKNQYSTSLESAYNTLDELLSNSTITNSDKVEIINYLNDYEIINNDFFENPPTLPLSQELEDKVLKSDEIQNNILGKLSTIIAAKTDSTSKTSSNISNSISSQNNIVKVLSSFFTLVISGPIYYFIKKYKNGEITFNNIIDTINEGEKIVDKYSNVLTYINITEKINSQLEKDWQEVYNLVTSLQSSISNIRSQLLKLQQSDSYTFKEKLEEIEIQVLEIKLLVKQLPNYHQFISDLSKNLTKCTENKK